jgi:alkylation response protein AidB-like acyl-CoA dehydrogenase
MVSQLIKAIAGADLCRLFVEEAYGGVGIKALRICIVREELAQVSNTADGIFAELGLGTFGVNVVGREEQKKKYLPRVARGEILATFSLTEPNAGSDVAGIQATARADGDVYVLNGEKAFASVAGYADIYTVFAKTDPSKGRHGISAFIIDKGTPGLEIGRMYLLAGGPEFTINLTDCRVPRENLIGEEGAGFRIALGTLDVFRVTVGAAAVGMAQAAFEEAVSYAGKRIAFGQPIMSNQAIQFKLADMATEIEAARWLVYRAAHVRDEGLSERPIKFASMSKLFATEVAGRVTDEALQVHGGWGAVKGTKVERLWREARLPRLYEGTSEIQRNTIFREVMREGKR